MYIRLFIMLLVLYGVHIFYYYTAIRFFGITAPYIRAIVFWCLTFLTFGFIASAVLLRFASNGVTQVFYLLCALWLGVAVNLLFAVIIGWAAFSVSWGLRLALPMRTVASALVAATLLFSAYGVWNAFCPKVREIEVAMPGLPGKWLHKTAVQISDVHLGAIYTPRYFTKTAALINGLKPDVIFITGDLFDSIGADGLDDFVGPLNGLVAPDGVFYVNGNHENYIGMERVNSALAKTRLRVLHDEVASIDGMQIIGVDYPEPGSHRDAASVIRSASGYRPGAPTILLYHTPTSLEMKTGDPARMQTQTYWSPDTDFTVAKALGVNLQLSGHTHKGQMLPFVWLASYLYKGFDYGLHTDGAFSIYVTSGLGSFGPPMRTATASEIVAIRFR
ncbi:MAG: metallophosphoesterase, partial [Deltaproteobacteria bacterium]|nr:metallophosphoesterase [Deltaproteobacteria bacterium]